MASLLVTVLIDNLEEDANFHQVALAATDAVDGRFPFCDVILVDEEMTL